MTDLIDPDAFPDDSPPIPPPPPEASREAPIPMPTFAALPDKVSVGIVIFSYGGTIRAELWPWAVNAIWALRHHRRVDPDKVFPANCVGYGAERVRNKAVADALEAEVDFLLMVDADTIPDWHSAESDQVPFATSTLDFMLSHDGPCVVGAPYCAGPPIERVLVSRFTSTQNDNPDGAARGVVLENFSREEAATKRGIELVSSLPTGCLMIDLRVCKFLTPPWFTYEYKDPRWTEFASTEDTVFTRNLFYLGIPLYCAWQSWAAHIKDKHVGRPRAYPQEAVPRNVRKAWQKQEANRFPVRPQ